MTKEEIISAIADDKMMPFIQPEQLAEIVDFVIKNYKPSLFSNLDEAAKKIAYDICKHLPNGTEKDSIVYYAILAAKAGAEWMAGIEKRLRMEQPEVDLEKEESVGVAESPSKTFPRVNEFDCGSSYRH